MFENLKDAKRLLIEAKLVPMQGSRFQPTGFPDLGAATYQLADGTRMLLVESAQSIANRLENTIIGPDSELVEELAGLSYIRVKLTEGSDTKTNSLIEAHRINSPFIISDENFQKAFVEASRYEANKPLDWQKIATALFKFDVNSLLHGVFLANLGDGRIKMPRALSGFIEASDVQEVVSGGVKNNPIDPTGTLRAKNYDKDVYSNVPYQRVEYTAGSIKAYFNLDIGLLRSYTNGNGDAFELLVSLALYKVLTFLEDGTRLRTACDLKLEGPLNITEPEGFAMPERTIVLSFLKGKIAACKSLFADPAVTQLETATVIKKKSS
ncbi:type I-U CRISPR-associated RAMP protein Csb1/Cas7u [uncultured Desulfosarcina sp.]|uniref:type I-G CRISPR-associated RAMP protein Csb1/Cas7g n=1 Tax=uncultured Desulfosarcina sp. TaxID=218289 RepID=UPI0029C61190|nr:type I-U CRISPR-associated RAMP protein Csb1/Cas7u [uncultured Desulfosarcina sp.]